MTESEWLAGRCPHRMYGFVRGRATARRVRLYMVACCRLHADAFFDPRLGQAVDTAERCADDPRAEAVAAAVWEELVVTAHLPRQIPAGLTGEVADAILAAWQLLDEHWAGVRYQTVQHAVAHAAYLALRERPGDVFTGGDGDAAEYCARAVEAAGRLRLGRRRARGGGTRRRMAGLVWDLFGNPFRPVEFNRAWASADAVGLARAIYEGRAFDRLPLLADALMDAGCAEEAVLRHCRGEGPHVRGCWVVDWVLGKA